jgi:hypothetical protein
MVVMSAIEQQRHKQKLTDKLGGGLEEARAARLELAQCGGHLVDANIIPKEVNAIVALAAEREHVAGVALGAAFLDGAVVPDGIKGL